MKTPIISAVFCLLCFTGFSFYQNQFSAKPKVKIQPNKIINPLVIHQTSGITNYKTVLPNSGFNSELPLAPQGSRRYIKVCYLITPQEMTNSQFGTNSVTSVGWSWIALAQQSGSATGTIKVYLQNTTDVSYSKSTSFASAITGMTKVIDDSITIPADEGTFEINTDAGGPGTSSFSTLPGNGVYVAFEYETTTSLALPLGSPTVSCNDSLGTSSAFFTSQTLNLDSLSVSGIRPETRFGDSSPEDVEVQNIYTMGQIPVPWGFPDTIGISLQNFGSQSTNEINVKSVNQDNSQIILDTTFTISSSITSISMKLPDLFFPQHDLVVVKAIPGDVLDHVFEYCHEITNDAYNYADLCIPDDGGLGFTGANGNFVARFSNYSLQQFSIDAVDHCFVNDSGKGNQPYNIVIYGDNGSHSPGALLYISPLLFTPLGNNTYQKVTHQLPASVIIPPNSRFYVGYRQLQLINLSACYQNEAPVRHRTFFYSTPVSSTTWIDFENDSSFYRLDISPRTCKNLTLKVYLEGFFNGTSMINDKAVVVLRTFNSPYNEVSRDTSYLDSSGTGYFNFPQADKFSNYFFVINHRNHLETWSHNLPEKIDSCENHYNFTDSLSKSYGGNMKYVSSAAIGKQTTGAYVLFGGDINQDGVIDGVDGSVADNDASAYLTGYVPSDVNGNNTVDGTDLMIIENNSSQFISVIRP